MFKLAAFATISFATATPEQGCYLYSLLNSRMGIFAQVNVKSASTLEFSVVLNEPDVELSRQALVCEGEPYEWNSASSLMRFGTVLSICMINLRSILPEGFFTSYPIDLTYNQPKNSLNPVTNSLLVFTKKVKCEYFAPGTPYSIAGNFIAVAETVDSTI